MGFFKFKVVVFFICEFWGFLFEWLGFIFISFVLRLNFDLWLIFVLILWCLCEEIVIGGVWESSFWKDWFNLVMRLLSFFIWLDCFVSNCFILDIIDWLLLVLLLIMLWGIWRVILCDENIGFIGIFIFLGYIFVFKFVF